MMNTCVLLTPMLLLSLSWIPLRGEVPSVPASADSLPIVARSADGAGPLALVLTGDGNWAGFERTLADSLTSVGSPVLGVKMRTYLGRQRTPDEAATDLASALRLWMHRWRRERFIIIGYSRGADIAPFMVHRLPADLRQAIAGVALIGLEDHAGFHFHLDDLISDKHRRTDYDVGPELEALRGLNAICVRGVREHHPYCKSEPGLMRAFEHSGGHRVSGDADGATSTVIIDQLGLRSGLAGNCELAPEMEPRSSGSRRRAGSLSPFRPWASIRKPLQIVTGQ